MFKLLSQAREMEQAGRRIIHYEIGDPNFNSPDAAKQAAFQALDKNLTHYTDSMGLPALREAVAQNVSRQLKFRPLLEQVLICPANALIDYTVRCTADPGDEVIYPDPGFSTYYSVIHYNGIKPVGIPLREENGFRLDPADIRSAITPRTRLIIINSPSNPTGAVMTRQDVLEVARIAEEHDLYLLTDETYSQILYDARHYSPALVDRCKERTILISSFSKTYAMSGWRLGYAVGPKPLIAKMGLLLQTVVSCLPGFVQAAGVAVLQKSEPLINQYVHTLRQRRDLLVDGLNRLPGVSCLLPQGAFYAFASIKNTGMTSSQYASLLLQETGVCVLPGDCFGIYGEGYVRLSFASTGAPDIAESLHKIQSFHQKFCEQNLPTF